MPKAAHKPGIENWRYHLFKDTIKGLEKVFAKDIERPKVILITGPPGSMKSSFTFKLLTEYLRERDEFGLYATLEENADSHLKNMESIGINPSLNMQITDFTDLRAEDGDSMDYLQFTEKMVRHFRSTRGDKFTTFAFDSLGALYSLMEDKESMRRRMYHFFKTLRDHNIYSFILMERALDGESNLLGNEGFLCDGIIMLGLRRKQGRLIRFVQVEKMRTTKHSMEEHALQVKGGEFHVLGPIFDQ